MTTQLKRLFLPFVVACVVLGVGPANVASAAVVYAVGDIACDPDDADFNNGLGSTTRCRQKYTADIINNEISAGRAPDSIIVLGDLQYNAGSLSNFNASYALSWGQTALKSRTRPVIGNHEGTSATSGAGYCSYFGAAAHCNSSGRQGNAAYYSFDVGDWHVVVINSNCTAAGGCAAGTPQYQWLASDLDANAGRACTMAVWHHPRWSSGHDGSNAFMQPIWQLFHAKGGDLVLSGHSHNYERFAPIDGSGAVNNSTGMRSFVVGTGGAFFTGLSSTRAPGSQVRQNTSFGVLKLTLNPTSYAWEWVTAAGSPAFSDSGAQTCRTNNGADTQAPTMPSNLRSTSATDTKVDLAWDPSTDNVGVVRYTILRSAGEGPETLVGTTNGPTTFSDVQVAPSTTYRYTVRAEDLAGNVSEPSTAVTVTTPPSGGSVKVFTAIEDSTIESANPTRNNGIAPRLVVDGSPQTDMLVKFDVSGCTSPSNAKLRLTVGNSTDDNSVDGGRVSRVGTSWTEGAINWNNAPARGTTTVPANPTRVALNQAVEFDVSSMVTTSGTVAFRAQSANSDGARYFSRQGGDPGAAPQLQVACNGGATPDTQAPTTPAPLLATATSPTTVQLVWADSTDNVAVTGYEVSRDGVVLTTTSGTTPNYDDTGLQPSTSYAYAVRARDAAGNFSAAATTTVRTQDPPTGATLAFAATDDATLDATAATTNLGTASRLTVDNDPQNEILMKFTVSGTGTGTNCPTISAAQIRMTVGSGSTDGSTGGGGIFRAAATTPSWTEQAVTWSTAPPATGTTLDTVTGAVTSGSVRLIDVTTAVTGNGTYSFRVSGNSGDGARYYSRNGNAATLAPELRVTCGTRPDF
jgi:Calcineurin-like phosphoesterase